MSSPQDHAGRTARLQRFAPAGRTQAPAVAGPQAGKAELGHRRRKIIAGGFGKLQKRGIMTAQTVWLPRSSGLVLQQPSRKNPVLGIIEQTSSLSPRTFRGALGRPPPFPLSSLSIANSWVSAMPRRGKDTPPKVPNHQGQPDSLGGRPLCLPIPMNPPVCNGMIAPRDSWMMPPPCNEMIPPGAPRLLALEVLSPYGGSVKPSWTACRERGGGSRRSTRCDERCGGGGPGWRPRRWGPQQRHARRTGEAER